MLLAAYTVKSTSVPRTVFFRQKTIILSFPLTVWFLLWDHRLYVWDTAVKVWHVFAVVLRCGIWEAESTTDPAAAWRAGRSPPIPAQFNAYWDRGQEQAWTHKWEQTSENKHKTLDHIETHLNIQRTCRENMYVRESWHTCIDTEEECVCHQCNMSPSMSVDLQQQAGLSLTNTLPLLTGWHCTKLTDNTHSYTHTPRHRKMHYSQRHELF